MGPKAMHCIWSLARCPRVHVVPYLLSLGFFRTSICPFSGLSILESTFPPVSWLSRWPLKTCFLSGNLGTWQCCMSGVPEALKSAAPRLRSIRLHTPGLRKLRKALQDVPLQNDRTRDITGASSVISACICLPASSSCPTSPTLSF